MLPLEWHFLNAISAQTCTVCFSATSQFGVPPLGLCGRPQTLFRVKLDMVGQPLCSSLGVSRHSGLCGPTYRPMLGHPPIFGLLCGGGGDHAHPHPQHPLPSTVSEHKIGRSHKTTLRRPPINNGRHRLADKIAPPDWRRFGVWSGGGGDSGAAPHVNPLLGRKTPDVLRTHIVQSGAKHKSIAFVTERTAWPCGFSRSIC